MSDKRSALRVIPKYDPDNNIGAVDRVRFCIINNRMDELRDTELEQLERWKQIDAWIREKRYATIDAKGENTEAYIHGHRQIRALVMSYFNISWDTAERDIANTKKFCAEAYDDQQYYRSVYIEQAEQRADEAMARGKCDAAAKFMAFAAELRGLLTETPVEIPADKIEAFQLLIEYNPEAVGLKTIENKEELFEKWLRRKKSVSDVMNKEADDAESE